MERPNTPRKSSTVARLFRLCAILTPVEWGAAIVLLCAFVDLAGHLMANQAFSFDLPLMQALRRLESSWLTVVMQVVSVSASVVGTTVFALVLCIIWWLAGRRPDAIALALGLIVSAALGQALKHIFCRPRPDLLPWLTATHGWSFPSGHTLNAVTLAGLLAWLIGRRLIGCRRCRGLRRGWVVQAVCRCPGVSVRRCSAADGAFQCHTSTRGDHATGSGVNRERIG